MPGTVPPAYEVATGKGRNRDTAIRAALQGRVQQLRALQDQTLTSVLRFTILLPGETKETMTWKLTQNEVENLVTLAYPRSRSRPSRQTSQERTGLSA
jgi:phosphoribosyl-dephospho-CoA transferase